MNYIEKRKTLVKSLIERNILTNKNVIRAMLKVPREDFLSEDAQSSAYIDSPISIGSDQTISAPHMNAMMCEILNIEKDDKILEIGTGSGYHAALCAELISIENKESKGHVYTIERHKELAKKAKENLKKTGYENRVTVIIGDGTLGYPEKAPYDKILVTAASPEKIPTPLKTQLQMGGILCIPAGTKNYIQKLYKIQKLECEFRVKAITSVRFVPLIGKYGFSNDDE
ncbi:MAG: protein-L-isoaspartate(D-aspartate) O-methyltransferase [Candidatus Lokiarchaeota archaeon]|nr:protein-L-isoaspartate(D-aspartate) O-methyltransferase [Candidatus Lokiarchaeota archaeon]